MSTSPTFDLKTFQSEVFNDFTTVQLALHGASLDLNKFKGKVDLGCSPIGMFARALISLLRWAGRRSERAVKTKADFPRLQAKAANIASDSKIKKLLCPKLKAEISANLPVEAIRARMVRIVTAVLADKAIAEEFSIETEARLYSLVILKIWQTGIDAYCRPRRR